MDREAAMQKARKIKAEALGISCHSTSGPQIATDRPSHLPSSEAGQFTGKNRLKSHPQRYFTG